MINNNMWIKDLGNMYVESWGVSSPNDPGDVHGLKAPIQTKDSKRMKGAFTTPGLPTNQAAEASAMGVGAMSPVEEEEDKLIDKRTVLRILDHYLNELSDNAGAFYLTKLKNDIQEL